MANQFKLRLPEPLRERLEESIKESGNSLNTEIVQRLGLSFRFDEMREALRKEQQRTDEAQQRVNQLTDFLLQVTSKAQAQQKKERAA
jgi:hypothetical protein